MIVECSSCQTKFSVDSRQLSGIEDPRFHCCRCGNYFKISEASEATGTESTLETSSASKTLGNESDGADWTPDLDKLVDEYLGASAQEEKKVEQLAFPLQSEEELESQIVAKAIPPMEEEAPNITTATQGFIRGESKIEDEEESKFPRVDWGSSNSDLSVEVDLSSREKNESTSEEQKAEQSESKTLENAESKKSLSGVFSGKRNPRVAKLLAQARSREDVEAERLGALGKTTEEIEQLSGATLKDARKALKRSKQYDKVLKPLRQLSESARKNNSEETEPTSSFTADSSEKIAPFTAPQSKSTEVPSEIPTEEAQSLKIPSFSMPSLNLPSMPAVKIPNMAAIQDKAPVAFICSLPLLLLAAMAIGTANLESSPRILEPLLQANASYFPRIPPSGLDLGAMKSRFVPLDSGEMALEISGIILNGSKSTVSDLVIETTVYNESNEAIKELRINPNNLLKSSKLAQLFPDEILELQGQLASEPFLMTPNSSKSFKIVLPQIKQDTSGKAKWFSAKVRSVMI